MLLKKKQFGVPLLYGLIALTTACGGSGSQSGEQALPAEESVTSGSATPTLNPNPLPVPVEQDADGDGVADANDQCKVTDPGVLVDANGCKLHQSVVVVGNCQLNSDEIALINAHNQARAQARNCGDTWHNTVGPLRWDCQLAAAAKSHSQDMADNNYFDHMAKDGASPFERIEEQGYLYRYAGENIAVGQRTPEQAVAGWLTSPGHCENIMSVDFQDMGAGRSDNSAGTGFYWTANFGTRFQ